MNNIFISLLSSILPVAYNDAPVPVVGEPVASDMLSKDDVKDIYPTKSNVFHP